MDIWNQFETIITKWKKISTIVMDVGCWKQLRNGSTCEDKWGSIVQMILERHVWLHGKCQTQSRLLDYEYTRYDH